MTRLGKGTIGRSVCDNLEGSAVPKQPSETCSTPKRQYAVDMSLGGTGQAVVSKWHCLYFKQVVHVSVTTPKWTPSTSNYCCTQHTLKVVDTIQLYLRAPAAQLWLQGIQRDWTRQSKHWLVAVRQFCLWQLIIGDEYRELSGIP